MSSAAKLYKHKWPNDGWTGYTKAKTNRLELHSERYGPSYLKKKKSTLSIS